MQIRRVEWDDEASVALRKAQQAEIRARYGEPSEPGPVPTGLDVTTFLVAFDDDGNPLGCGGLRRLDDEHAEIKRMFVRSAHRGSGVSTALLQRLELAALAAGWSRLVLETGELQPDAIRFYQREGYTRIPNFGYYAGSDDSVCFEKVLVAVDPAASVACEGCE
ncbi:MAG: GCN5-related N-acetyltransferase [Microbacteriaceae bacterium]|nr:GCN5-related N-acetyltransferase [Microbacteriaceae bacterium]